MKSRALILILLTALIITPMSMARADCDDHWEGAAIALGATMLLNTILWGVPSPVVPPPAHYYAPPHRVYYGSYCPPTVVEHYNYYYSCPPRVHVWIENDPPYCYRPYWRRPRVYHYHYNYNYNYHYHYRNNHCNGNGYCDPYYNHSNYYRHRKYIRY